MVKANKLALSIAVGLASFCIAVTAQQLPKSGTINLHAGIKIAPDAMEVAEKTMVGHGSSVGVLFNDQGDGPFNGGPLACTWAFSVVDGASKVKGYCAYGDQDKDRMFVDFNGGPLGEGNGGPLQVLGGIGKYKAIQGNGEWRCKVVGPNGQEACTAQVNYRFP